MKNIVSSNPFIYLGCVNAMYLQLSVSKAQHLIIAITKLQHMLKATSEKKINLQYIKYILQCKEMSSFCQFHGSVSSRWLF